MNTYRPGQPTAPHVRRSNAWPPPPPTTHERYRFQPYRPSLATVRKHNDRWSLGIILTVIGVVVSFFSLVAIGNAEDTNDVPMMDNTTSNMIPGIGGLICGAAVTLIGVIILVTLNSRKS